MQHRILSDNRQLIDFVGDPGRDRTCDLQIRNLPLYPTELRDHAARHITASVPRAKSEGAGSGARTDEHNPVAPAPSVRHGAPGAAAHAASAVSVSFTQ